MNSSRSGKNRAPKYHVERRVFSQWQPLEKPVSWPFPYEIAEIEYRGNPVVLRY